MYLSGQAISISVQKSQLDQLFGEPELSPASRLLYSEQQMGQKMCAHGTPVPRGARVCPVTDAPIGMRVLHP